MTGGPVKWPVLADAALGLRPAGPADAEAWFAFRTAAGPWQTPIASVEAARRMLAEMDAEPAFTPGWRQFLVEEDGRPVGDIGLCWPEGGAPAEIGFELAPEARGRGFATRSLRLLCGWLVGEGGLSAVIAITHQANAPARATLEATGFRCSADAALAARFALQADECLYILERAGHA